MTIHEIGGQAIAVIVGLHTLHKAGHLSKEDCDRLIKDTLQWAVAEIMKTHDK